MPPSIVAGATTDGGVRERDAGRLERREIAAHAPPVDALEVSCRAGLGGSMSTTRSRGGRGR